ncbi:hypothetical protein B0H19DRAFT_1374428 [Mycena capillaripes]|nr:hypothetical protein B0H19DRAFT_1374428 [Mycena capillaripes]
MRPRLDIPELISRCLCFLDGSSVAACAFVNRSWRYAAQPHLFREITIGLCNEQCTRFLQVIDASPHLSRFVVRLEFQPGKLSPKNFAVLVQLPLPKLRILCISMLFEMELSERLADGIQRLLSLSGLHSIQLRCWYNDPPLFHHMWARAAQSIRHVWLSCPNLAQVLLPRSDARVRAGIPLESLTVNGDGIHHWLGMGHSPFDFGHLKALHLFCKPAVLRMPAFASALAKIELLDVEAPWPKGAVDLSAYQRLDSFRVRCRTSDLSCVAEALGLASIPNEIRVREILIYGSAVGHIERHLTRLPLSCRRKIQVCISSVPNTQAEWIGP